MSNSGLWWQPFIPLTDFNNRSWSNRTKKQVFTNLYYVHLIQLLMRQTDQQMEQLSDLNGQSPKSSARMPTSGLTPSPKGFITGSLKNNSVDQHSLEGRRGGGGPMCNPDTHEQESMVLALVGLSIYEEGPDATTKVQNSKVLYKRWTGRALREKARTTPNMKTEGSGEGLVSMELSRNVWTTWKGILE